LHPLQPDVGRGVLNGVTGLVALWQASQGTWPRLQFGLLGSRYPGEVSELADERDLGSRGAIRESSSLSFPTWRRANACALFSCGSGSAVEHLLAKERVASSNLVFRSGSPWDHDWWSLVILGDTCTRCAVFRPADGHSKRWFWSDPWQGGYPEPAFSCRNAEGRLEARGMGGRLEPMFDSGRMER
jgi:hypothetical protein